MISLREYGYRTDETYDYRIKCMRQCLDENNIDDFTEHCLHVGQFQEIVLDDFLTFNLELSRNQKIDVFEMKRRHGAFEERRKAKEELEKMKNERDTLKRKYEEVETYRVLYDTMSKYARCMRENVLQLEEKVSELNNDVMRLSEAGERRVHGNGVNENKRKKLMRHNAYDF